MSKKYIKTDIDTLRKNCKDMLEESFYRLWMNRFDFKELGRKEKRTIMKNLWTNGTISCGQIAHLSGPESLFFTGWTTQNYDYMYEPEIIRFVNTRGVAFIPLNEQIVNKTCALGWANSSRNPIRRSVEYFIDRMVECELILHTNLLTQQVPFLVNIPNGTELKAKDLIDKLFNYEPVIFTEGEINQIQALMTGAPWIADKIRGMYYDYQAQCYTILGLDNTKLDSSDKQFMLTEQLDSNIGEINLFKNDIDTTIQQFLDDIEEFSGVKITLVNNVEDTTSLYQENKQPSIQEGDNNNEQSDK